MQDCSYDDEVQMLAFKHQFVLWNSRFNQKF